MQRGSHAVSIGFVSLTQIAFSGVAYEVKAIVIYEVIYSLLLARIAQEAAVR